HRVHPSRRLPLLHAHPPRPSGAGAVLARQGAATRLEGERRLETRVPARLSAAEGRRFGLSVGGMFLVLGAVLWWRGHATAPVPAALGALLVVRSEEHTSELQSRFDLVCRLLLEKKDQIHLVDEADAGY